MCVGLTPAVALSIILAVWSWLNPLGCHTEALPTSQSIGRSSGGVGEDGGMTGEGDIVGDNGGGREGVKEEVRSEEAVGWRVSSGEGATRVGERGGGRDEGAGLEERGGGTEGGLEARGRGGLETGGRGGGRDGGVDGGSWEDFGAGGGGLGRHGRAGGREEGRDGGEWREDGGTEAIEGTAGVSSAPVRGLVWL